MRPRSRATAGLADRVGRERVRLAEVPRGERTVDEALGEAEPVEQLRALDVLERLFGRTAEVGGCSVRVALGQRAVGCLAERRDPELDRPRPRQQQVRGDLLGRSVRLGEQRCRRGVLALALCAVQLGVDRGPHDRVHEGEVAFDAQQPVPRKRRGGVRGELGVDAGERRRVGQPHVVAEDGDRLRERGCLDGQPRQSKADRARDGLGADLVHALRVLRLRRDPLARKRVEERAEEQRVAAGRLVARVGELDVDVARERLADQRRGRVQRQRLRADHDRTRVADHLGDERLLVRLGGRARPDDDEDRQSLEPARGVAQPAKRCGVAPVQVVDGEQQRLARREVSGEPEEPVQRRERVVRKSLRVAQPPLVEERRGERGGAREQLLALLSRGEREHGLEELANDAERELVLPLAAARGQHPHPRRGRERARLADEAGLPDPGVALDRDEATVAPARNLDHRAQRRELRLALEQDEAAGGDARACARRELRKGVGQPGHDELVEPLRAGRDPRGGSRRGRGARPRAGGRAPRAALSSRTGGSGRRGRRRRSARPGGRRSRRIRPRRASPRPVWMPMRTRTTVRSGHSWRASACWPAIAPWTAAPALRKTAKNESPCRSISVPPASSKACRRSSLWIERTRP